MTWKYLHKTGPHTWVLDHRLLPEVRAMFLAMASRMPAGGIEARYSEVVEAIVEDLRPPDQALLRIKVQWHASGHAHAEGLLTSSIPKKAQEFFDIFVGKFGHSSIKELTGSPSVFVEGVSLDTAYESFDSPLVRGQEFSTRAKRMKDWPMCAEASAPAGPNRRARGTRGPPIRRVKALPVLRDLHEAWLEVFDHEVKWWKAERLEKCANCRGSGGIFANQMDEDTSPCKQCRGTGQKHPDFDPQGAFRFAYDRARWALPGTIATGFGHAGDLRTMSRVIAEGAACATNDETKGIWAEIGAAYDFALPAMAGMGLKEALTRDIVASEHLQHPRVCYQNVEAHQVEVEVFRSSNTPSPRGTRKGRSYADPAWNQHYRCDVRILCSKAVSRDWHRHRTFYPWRRETLVGAAGNSLSLHPAYAPKSSYAQEHFVDLWVQTGLAYTGLTAKGDHTRAELALPLGTAVMMSGSAGLRDFLYTMELRRDAHGANFEYQQQAADALVQLAEELPTFIVDRLLPSQSEDKQSHQEEP